VPGHFFFLTRCASVTFLDVFGQDTGQSGPAWIKQNSGSLPLIKLDYLAPPAELSAFVSAYYLFRTDDSVFHDIERADIAQFRVILEGDGDVVFGDGRRQSYHPINIMGPRTKASRVEARGPIKVFGVGLLPAGWAAFTRLPADKHINSLIEGSSILGSRVLETFALLKEMDSIADMAALMNERSRNFAEGAQSVPYWFIRAVDRWLEERLSPELEDLEAATNLSRRQIERLARQVYGSPPKLLVRKYRALRTANAIAHGRGDWQDFVDKGYYDQSHCIREMKEFIGITPGAIRDHTSPLTSQTFDRSQLFGQIATLSAQT